MLGFRRYLFLLSGVLFLLNGHYHRGNNRYFEPCEKQAQIAADQNISFLLLTEGSACILYSVTKGGHMSEPSDISRVAPLKEA